VRFERAGRLCCLIAACLFGCAGATYPSALPKARSAARLPLHVYDQTPNGMRLLSLPRPTGGVLRLSLFIDAGSRDATPPQAATLSAWLAAEGGGPQIEALVFPDVTELSLPCTTDQLDACAEQLARALATRDPAPDKLATARTRLRDGQRRALAHDPTEPADALALSALLGPSASTFFALGAPDSDPVAAATAVPAFLREHYGVNHSLLVAAGDCDPARVREIAGLSFARASRAEGPRPSRALTSHEPALALDFDQQPAAAVAIAGHDAAQLTNLVGALTRALERADRPIELEGHVFAVRGGAMALLRARDSDPELALERIARELARLRLEPPSDAPPPLAAEDLISISRRAGIEFGADGGEVAESFSFGIGVLLAAGPGDGSLDRDKELADQQHRSEHAQDLFARAIAQAEPHTRGDVDEYAGSVVSENGARIDAQFSQGDDVAIAIRVAPGAEQDSPLMHGQSALLATLTGIACAGMGPELVQRSFADLGASFEVRVDPESYGLLVRVPKAHWQEGLDLGLRCARAPSSDPHFFVDATLQLQMRLRAHAGALTLRARAAELIAPRAPGRFAPWGDPERIGNLTQRDFQRAIKASEQASRWAVSVVGPVPVRAALEYSARRIADFAPGVLPKLVPITEVATTLPNEGPRSNEVGSAKLVAAWSVRGKFQHPLGAVLFARSIGALLSAVPGVEVLWQDGDVQQGVGFAAVALRVRTDVGASLGPLLQAAARGVDDAWLDRALKSAADEARAGQSGADAMFSVRAEQVARSRLGAQFAEPSEKDARELLGALRASQPGWISAR
jgi:predicted Zn-dependent peptidase